MDIAPGAFSDGVHVCAWPAALRDARVGPAEETARTIGLAWRRDGARLASIHGPSAEEGTSGRHLLLWDLATGTARALEAPGSGDSWARCAVWLQTGELVTGDDKTARGWDVDTGHAVVARGLDRASLAEEWESRRQLISAAVEPRGNLIVFGSKNQNVFVWATRAQQILVPKELRHRHSGAVRAEYYSATADSIDGNTVFATASLSKWITAHAVMKLVEQGKLDLDRPVESYLTRWRFRPERPARARSRRGGC